MKALYNDDRSFLIIYFVYSDDKVDFLTMETDPEMKLPKQWYDHGFKTKKVENLSSMKVAKDLAELPSEIKENVITFLFTRFDQW